MLRSFTILWFAVFTPLILLVIPTDLNPLQALSKSMSERFFKPIYSTSVNLLEEQLLAQPPEQWQETIKQHNQFFYNPLKLKTLKDYQSQPGILNELRQGNIAFEFDSPMALLKRVGRSQHVIYYALQESEESIVANQAKGALYLAKQDLLKHPKEQWGERLALNHSELPITIKLVEKPNVPDILLEKLEATDDFIASHTLADRSTIQLLTQVDNEHWILVTDEGSRTVKMKLITYAAAALFGLISAALILWVYPLWRDLKGLARTANAFGRGVLTRRAKTSSLSVVSQLSDSFNQMANNIEQLIASQRELTRAVAHDLRTPLYRLRFALEMLEDETVSEAQKNKYRRTAISSLDSLDQLINQTLLLSRYNRVADVSHFSVVKFGQRLAREIEDFQLEHYHFNVNFRCEDELLNLDILIDERGLIRAINNLLSNAARFAKHTIQITFTRVDNNLTVIVEDDGIGIDKTMRDKVFEPFIQLDNQERSSDKGYGLGLAIVKQIALWHDGKVTVEHSKLGGAKFVLCWPVRVKQPQRSNVTDSDTNRLKTDKDL